MKTLSCVLLRVALVLVLTLPITSTVAQEGRGSWTLSLVEAVERAIENNLDIAVARLGPASASEAVNAEEAVFDPTFSSGFFWNEREDEPTSNFSQTSSSRQQLQASYSDPLATGGQWSAQLSHADFEQEFPAGVVVALPEVTSSSLTLSVEHSLLRNFGLSINETAIEQARNNLRISQEQFHDQVIAVVQQVENAYWDLVGAIKQLEVARGSQTLAQDFLEQTKIRVEVGTLPPIEITQAEAAVAERSQVVIAAENAVRDAEDILRALIRVPDGSPDWDRPVRPTDEPGFSPVPIDTQQAIGEALERRYEVAEAQLRVRNQELTERFQRNQLRPDLVVSGDYTASGNDFELASVAAQQSELLFFDPVGGGFLYAPGDAPQFASVDVSSTTLTSGSRGDSLSEIADLDNTNWTVSATFSIPIGNRRARADHARARIAVDQARLQLDSVRQTVKVEVRQAVRAAETAARQVSAARANLELQRKKLDAEQKRYDNGLSTAFQVLEFQNALIDAERGEIAAIIPYNKALTTLDRVKATLLEARGIDMS
ncbi:MAG: TolC family protein [Acidobacteriota bacterium]|nr:MAG: TolC family protein [Acidobacteriota bacterium]